MMESMHRIRCGQSGQQVDMLLAVSEGRVGQGPLRFAFGPLTEAASWGLQREAAGGRRSKTPTPEREAGAVNSGNEDTAAEAGAVRAHTEADRRKAVFPVSCDVKW